MRATPKTSLPVNHYSLDMRDSRKWASILLNIPSPARGPRETFSLAAAGAFLGGIVLGGRGVEYGERRGRK